MDKSRRFEPHKITKPIQLLAAWLTGLILVNSAFLVAASKIQNPSWVAGALVIASIANVPMFLISIFLLQTKFRPEMQEDSFYSKYLESKTGQTDRQVAPEFIGSIREDLSKIENIISEKLLENKYNGPLFQDKAWRNVVVSVNKSWPHFIKLVDCLHDANIPVHELFGGGGHLEPPKELRIAVGAGFSTEQILSIVKAVGLLGDGWVSYAHDDDEENEYDNTVLIGAWGSYEHGVKLSQFIALTEGQETTEDELYKILGK